jgi:hypothetical protein
MRGGKFLGQLTDYEFLTKEFRVSELGGSLFWCYPIKHEYSKQGTGTIAQLL